MRFLHLLRSGFIAATLVGGFAHAQTDSFSLNFGAIKFEYDSQRTGAVPFGLDIVLGEEGSVRLLPLRGRDFVFESASLYSSDPSPASLLFFDLLGARSAIEGVLSVAVDQASASGTGGGPHIKIFSGDSRSGASVHSGGVQFAMGDGSVHFIRDNIDTRLSGEPAALFNQPGPGEPLVATLPTPAPGQTIALKLQVKDDRGASMSMPVRISHPR